jgi:transposase
MAHYIGIDLHRQFIQVSVLTEAGQEQWNGRLDLDAPDEVVGFFSTFPATTEVVMEATLGWMWLADRLEELGLVVHLAHSAGVRAIAESRLKTDRIDARILAQLLRTEFLPEAYLAPADLRNQRMLLRHREGLVRARTSVKNRVHALLARYNIHLKASDIFGQRGMAGLRGLALPAPAQEILQDLLAHLEFVNGQIRQVEGRLEGMLSPEERLGWVRTVPGIGKLTGYFLLAEMGPVERFSRPAKLVSYCGLCPSTRQSAAKVYHGGTAGAGRRYLKWALVEAAHTAVRHDAYFAGVFHRLAQRRGRQKAYVAVAREMAQILWHLLREHRPYLPKVRLTQVGSAAAMTVRA